jgi:hypothetical protein
MSDLTETAEETTSEVPAWTAQLPDDYKNDPDFTGHAKLGDLAKNYKELKGKAEKSVEIPGDEASDEERTAFFTRLGRPEKAEDYEFETPTLPEGMAVSDDLVQGFRGKAHSLGLNKGQAQALYNWFNEASAGLYNTHQGTLKQQTEKASKELKEEWGTEHKANLTLAERAAKHYGFEDFKGMSNADKKACLKIAQAVGEATFISGSTPSGNGSNDLNTIYTTMQDMPDRVD